MMASVQGIELQDDVEDLGDDDLPAELLAADAELRQRREAAGVSTMEDFGVTGTGYEIVRSLDNIDI